TRHDDTPAVIPNRLPTTHETPAPLVPSYHPRSVRRRIGGEEPPNEVAEQIRRTLATLRMEQDEAV
ncbi:MAG: hypothetical protein ACTHNP_07425, partial [Solirubrobacterales bacterium]